MKYKNHSTTSLENNFSIRKTNQDNTIEMANKVKGATTFPNSIASDFMGWQSFDLREFHLFHNESI